MAGLNELIEAAKQGDLEKAKELLRENSQAVHQTDELGATALHWAAYGGHCAVVHLLLESGADINRRDSRFHATPAGWAIEYLREVGGLLGIELDDFAFAIQRGDVEWAARFLRRLPALRYASDPNGVPFTQLAAETENAALMDLFPVEKR